MLLDTAFQDMLAIHQYAPGVSRLLGELLAAAVLLRSTLKFEGKLVLQARSEGQIPLLNRPGSCSDTTRSRHYGKVFLNDSSLQRKNRFSV